MDKSNIQETGLQIIFDFIKYAKRKYKILIFSLLFGISIAFILILNQKKIYIANFSFSIDEEKGGLGSLGGSALGLASQFGFDANVSGGGAFASTNIAEILKSDRIINAALQKDITLKNKNITLYDLYVVNNNLEKSITQIGIRRLKKQVIKSLKDEIIVNQKDKKISIWTLKISSYDSNFAKYFSESLIDETSIFYIKTKSKKAQLNVELLQKQSDSVRQILFNSISNAAKSSDQVYNLNSSFNTGRIPTLQYQTYISANTEILKQLVGNLELAKINLRKETPLIQVIDFPEFPLEEIQFSKFIILVFSVFISLFITLSYLFIFFIVKRNQ